MLRHLFILLACCSGLVTQAQNFQYSFQADKVMFSGSGYINIRQDSLGTVYSGAHWLSTGAKLPVAYTSGNFLTIAADFSYKCEYAPDSVMVRGWGSDTINFPLRTIPVRAGAPGTYAFSYPATEATKVLTPGKVNYYAPFLIRWEVSLDKGKTWLAMDTTDHKVYVTKAKPMTETTRFRYYHTVLELSCKNAKGLSSDSTIIKACWNEFTDQVLLNYKGDSLHYYKTLAGEGSTLDLLLQYRNAQCYTFAQLFLALLKIQGIDRKNNYVRIEPKYTLYGCGEVEVFLVKNWTFGTKSAVGTCPDFPYANTFDGTLTSGSAYTWLSADVTDQKGVAGQCSANPSSFFNNHQVVKLDGIYYDPSYGTRFDSLAEIKTKAFDGWGINSYGAYNTCYFTNDLSKEDLQETITTY